MENQNALTLGTHALNLLSKSGEIRILSFFGKFKEYMQSYYETRTGDMTCSIGKFGATFRFRSEDIEIEIKVWQYSNGYLNLPDDIIIISEFDTDNDEQYWEGMSDLCRFLIEEGHSRGFIHMAI